MNNKSRLEKLEKSKKNNMPIKTIVMFCADEPDGTAKFDGVEMSQQEAERKADELPENVILLRVIRAGTAMDKQDS